MHFTLETQIEKKRIVEHETANANLAIAYANAKFYAAQIKPLTDEQRQKIILKMKEQEAKTPGIYTSEQNDEEDVIIREAVQINSNSKQCHKK